MIGPRTFFTVLLLSVSVHSVWAAGARVKLWELPEGEPVPTARDDWKPAAKGVGSVGSLAVENKYLLVAARAGVTDLVLWAREGENEPENKQTKLVLALLDSAGKALTLTKVEATEVSANGVTLKLTAGTVAVLLTVGAERQYVKLKPEKDAVAVEVRASFRYAMLPDFFADDVIFDPRRYKAERFFVPAENFLFGFVDGGHALVMCVWPGNLGAAKEGDAAKANPAAGDASESKVELVTAGEDDARRFGAARIEFLNKPIYVAALCREGYWHDADVSAWEAQKPTKIEWRRPFEAKWRADSLCKEGKRSEDFFVTAQSRVFFEEGKPGAIKWTSEGGLPLHPLTCQQGLWPYYIHAAWFNKKTETWLAPYADRGARDLKAYQNRIKAEAAAAKKEDREYKAEPFKVANIFDRVIIYPLDRTEATPADVFTPVDIMRDTLGQGPCEYVLDLEGIQNRRHHGGETKMHFETATCGIRDKVINPILQEVKKLKEGEKLDEQKKLDLLHGMNDMLLFVTAVHQRIEDYSRFNKEALNLCAQVKDNVKTKSAVEQVEPVLQEMRKQLERLLDWAGKEQEKWKKTMPELVGKVQADDYKAAGTATGICSYAERQDVMMAQSRRFTRGVRGLAATTEAVEPDAQRFIEELREMCRKTMRRPHPMEGD